MFVRERNILLAKLFKAFTNRTVGLSLMKEALPFWGKYWYFFEYVKNSCHGIQSWPSVLLSGQVLSKHILPLSFQCLPFPVTAPKNTRFVIDSILWFSEYKIVNIHQNVSNNLIMLNCNAMLNLNLKVMQWMWQRMQAYTKLLFVKIIVKIGIPSFFYLTGPGLHAYCLPSYETKLM